MINFSPFLALSGGLVTSVGFVPPFSDAGVAAQRIPHPQKRAIEMATKTKRDLLNFILIVPPTEYQKHHTRLTLEMNRVSVQNQ